jgi:hypothetical protein
MRASQHAGRILAVVVCLVVLGAGTAVAVSYSTSTLKGRWAIHLEPATSFGGSVLGNSAGVAAAARQHILRVGFVDWDGAGAASGRFLATTDTNSGQTMTIDYYWSGTYTVDPNGTGTLTIAMIEATPAVPLCTPDPPPEGGICTDYIAPSPASPVPAYVAPETFGMVISKRYGRVSLVQQDNVGGAKIFLRGEAVRQKGGTTPYFFTTGALRRTWSFELVPATGFSAIDPTDAGGVASAPRQDVLRVGYIEWNGFGDASGRTIATTDDNTGSTVIINFQWLGTYTVNSDGTGTLSITPFVTDADCTPAQAAGICATFEGPETYNFAMSKSRQRMFLVETDNVGGGAKIFLRGRAQRQ